jgi:hypothetical protein
MKTRLLSLALFLGIIHLSAQITITSADMPQPGDSVRVSNATATSVNYMNTGPNVLWDFSSLVPNSQQMLRYIAPANLPFNIISTVSIVNPSPDSIPLLGAVPNNFTDYFKLGNSSYKQNGISFEYPAITSFAIPVLYSSSDYVYRFPMVFGNEDSCHAAYSVNIPNLAYVGEDIHRVNQVDGWGALITPFGIFNTLRVKSILDRTDTISLDTLGFGISIPRPTQIQYKWLAAGMKIPVLEIDADIILNNEVVSKITYQDSLRDSVMQVGIAPVFQNISGTIIFPNPANGNSSLYYQLSNSSTVEIYLTDLTGRKIETIANGFENSGSHIQPIDLNGINAGLYFVQIVSGSSTTTQKIVVGN